ncbi:hypothetical protein RN001_010385 [Aquatica leii]|uniref:Gamma-tubulin complex component n=1 Tax=Aquatica leii TaxID=1421715 RepID=A0AAN7PUS2_9COLE|nr:hypothetical protein RN001_010385 [Aquatica leii]
MSILKTTLINTIHELITQVTDYQEGSKDLKTAFDKISPQLQSYNTVYLPNKREIDSIVRSLGEKFSFHGYIRQKNHLLSLYQKLIPEDELTQETLNRLSVIKLLIGLSDSPTNKVNDWLQKYPQEPTEVIDWGSYLSEGIERWSPPPYTSSESDDVSDFDSESTSDFVTIKPVVETVPDGTTKSRVITLDEARSTLTNTVQSHWFNSKKFYMKPSSETDTGNLAILWHNHLETITNGLILTETPNVITEYHVLREIIWQMHVQHSSACFRVIGNHLEPASNVTISSVRLEAFQSFLQEFTTYVKYFHVLRKFSESISFLQDDVPNTYRSYNCAVESITKPMLEMLVEIEHNVMKQETVYTLLVLAKELRTILKPLQLLDDIHRNVILDFKSNSSVLCATTLLSALYKRLFATKSKFEQDLYLTLYLQSLYKYFMVINSWLDSGDLDDCAGEFVIAEELEDGQIQFVVKDLNEAAKEDPILSLICTQVLQIGKNIRLLRRLGKVKLFFEYAGDYTENFYDAFIRKVLEQIAIFFDVPIEQNPKPPEDVVNDSPEFVFPGLGPDDCKYYTEMDKLENLVDTSDGFLMKAFESYFVKKPEKNDVEIETLYSRIRKLAKTLFPIHNIITNVFVEILDERYSKLGFIVKKILAHDYELEKHFVFLQQIFLFKDDMIFPFYRHLFDGLDSNHFLGNHAWLTSFLQDVIVDAYPNFYDKTSVELNDDYQVAKDPLKACQMINVKYRIDWPVNVIITNDHVRMYREMFQFILKIKWALYTLNHLYFSNLESKKKTKLAKPLRAMLTKLQILRFGLLNIVSSVQHYILGHAYSELSLRFTKELEKAYDLESLNRAHADYVAAIHKVCCDFQEYERNGHGFLLMLDLVRKLKLMWRNVGGFTYGELSKCEKSYWMCHKKLDGIMNTSMFPTSRIFVRAGSSIREQGGQRKSVAKNFVHPDWNKPPFDNDVAVLVLTEPLALNSEVQIVELATSDHVPVGAIATVTGWGKTENNTLATTLQKLETPKNSNTVCKQHYPFFNVNTMVCYGGVSGVSSCSADSGGPLVYNNVQVGIVSLGSIKCEGTSPTIYARVEHFLDYIQSNM